MHPSRSSCAASRWRLNSRWRKFWKWFHIVSLVAWSLQNTIKTIMSGQFIASLLKISSRKWGCMRCSSACHVSFVTGHWSILELFSLSFNSPSLRFQICVWIKPVPKETPQGAKGWQWSHLGKEAATVCYSLHHFSPSGWDCQDQNLYFLFESIGESQNCTPDLPTICLTVIVKSYVDAAKSRMLASKIEKSCGVKQAVKWWMWIDMDGAFQSIPLLNFCKRTKILMDNRIQSDTIGYMVWGPLDLLKLPKVLGEFINCRTTHRWVPWNGHHWWWR